MSSETQTFSQSRIWKLRKDDVGAPVPPPFPQGQPRDSSQQHTPLAYTLLPAMMKKVGANRSRKAENPSRFQRAQSLFERGERACSGTCRHRNGEYSSDQVVALLGLKFCRYTAGKWARRNAKKMRVTTNPTYRFVSRRTPKQWSLLSADKWLGYRITAVIAVYTVHSLFRTCGRGLKRRSKVF